MNDPSRRRRQNEPPGHHAPNPRFQLQPQVPSPHSSSFPSGAAERYRPAPLSTSPSTPRTMGVGGSYSSYYQEPQAAFSTPSMSTTAMGYGADYASDARAQGQGFGGFIMYNVAQSSTQTPVYDSPQFAQRQQAAMQMMAPDVASTYFASEAGGSSLPHAAQGSGASSSEYQQQQQQQPQPQQQQQPQQQPQQHPHQHPQSASMGYGGHVPSVGTMQQQHQPPHLTAGAGASDGHDYHDAALEEKWVNYQRQLGTVFQDVRNASLENAAETLLGLSNWLLTQVADLGLSQDDASLHDERIKLWNDFNHAWLALGFQQKQLMQSGQQLPRPQGLMSEETIKKMGDELVRLCDGIERHGLVDYQYGVWEEQIESILEECLDLYESLRGAGEGDGPR